MKRCRRPCRGGWAPPWPAGEAPAAAHSAWAPGTARVSRLTFAMGSAMRRAPAWTTACRGGSGRRGPVIGPCGRIDLLRGIGTISTMAVVSDPTNPPSKPVTLYSAADAPAAALTGETVAVLGYGYLGRTAALNLR